MDAERVAPRTRAHTTYPQRRVGSGASGHRVQLRGHVGNACIRDTDFTEIQVAQPRVGLQALRDDGDTLSARVSSRVRDVRVARACQWAAQQQPAHQHQHTSTPAHQHSSTSTPAATDKGSSTGAGGGGGASHDDARAGSGGNSNSRNCTQRTASLRALPCRVKLESPTSSANARLISCTPSPVCVWGGGGAATSTAEA